MTENCFAHSLEGESPEKWQKLEDHLCQTAELAARFAAKFGAEEWGYLSGLWHDLGKYSPEFQKKLLIANGFEAHLEAKPGKVVHSHAGGHLAQLRGWKHIDRILAWVIMGHHAGLADWATDQTGAKALEPKMRNPDISKPILDQAPDSFKDADCPSAPKPLVDKADISFFIRMLFSCLVDADFLDTEAFMDYQRSRIRSQACPTVEELRCCFDSYMDKTCAEAEATPVNRIRAQVLGQCRIKAQNDPSVFSLTVPTGGGKTLSSLAFALRHAVKHKKQRIIYVIPYTSIIEQTADVFRQIPGFEEAVIEHHGNVEIEDETLDSIRSRLSAENWDAPVIVTTNVQFFESLYACKTSKCRKIHNIANSVVIFDEAQCLPSQLLRPVVYAIRELFRHYGVTPVLCTATQPVLTRPERFDFQFKEAFDCVNEIVEDPDGLARRLKRVNLSIFKDRLLPVSYEEVAESIVKEANSVLCIVNRKDDCRALAGLLPKNKTVHLSTNMCPAHRLKTFKTIKKRLNGGSGPIYVVSTSLVEAGVDLDFPVVYRALAGLDSIAQASGRCNREGRLPDFGQTVVFVPPSQPRYIGQAAALARERFNEGNMETLFSPNSFNQYFKQLFWQLGDSELDKKGILSLLSGHLDFYFRTAAERFKMIDDDWQTPLVVPYGEAFDLIDRLDSEPWCSRQILRRIQRLTINVPKPIHQQLLDEGFARPIPEYPGICFLETGALYDPVFGFVPPNEKNAYDPEFTLV